jgi:hypothetical protein
MNLFSGLKGEGLRQECCDHEWELQDESFSHEFGTEQVYFLRCLNCHLEKPAEASDLYYGEDYGPYDYPE